MYGARMAQLLEALTMDLRVSGSSPWHQGRIETFSTFSIENVRFSQFDYSNYNAKSNE